MINSPKSGYVTRIKYCYYWQLPSSTKLPCRFFSHEKKRSVGASFAFTFNPHRLVNTRLFRDPIGASGFTPNSHRPTRAFNDSWDGCHWISTFYAEIGRCLSQATKILEIFGCQPSKSAGRFNDLESRFNDQHEATLHYHI